MQNPLRTDESARDARIGAALDEFLERRRRGAAVDESAWLAENADIAEPLARHLALLRRLPLAEDPIGQLIAQGVLRPATDARWRAELNGYRVTGVLGRGGMGVVLEAQHVTLDRRVALKFLLPDQIGDSRAVVRFVAEARSQDKLEHSNIPRVRDVIESAGTPVLVMEFVDGCSLDELIRRRGPVPAALTVHIFIQLLEALKHAHGQGVVHRDIKPANILLSDPDGPTPHVKLADFGLARLLLSADGAASATRTKQAVGTPGYMAPEQRLAGAPVDHRVDLFAAGVVLHEMLTGRRLDEATDETRSVDPTLAALARELMAHCPSDRPPAAADVLLRLRGRSLFTGWSRKTGAAALGAAALVVVLLLATFLRPNSPRWSKCELDTDTTIKLTRENGQVKLVDASLGWSDIELTACTLVELDDGSQIVAVGCEGEFDEYGGTLAAFSPDGKLLWGPISLNSTIPWPDCDEISTAWPVRHLWAGDLAIGEGTEIVVAASHLTRYPASISRVDARTGAIRATFWHGGHFIGMIVVPDLLGAGRAGIVGWGHANLLGGFKDGVVRDGERQLAHWDQVLFVVVLEPFDMDGLGPPPIAESRWRDPSRAPAGRLPFAYAILNVPDTAERSPRPALEVDATDTWPEDVFVFIQEVKRADVVPEHAVGMAALHITIGSRPSEIERLATPALVVDRELNLLDVLASPTHMPEEGRSVQFWQCYWNVIVRGGQYVDP